MGLRESHIHFFIKKIKQLIDNARHSGQHDGTLTVDLNVYFMVHLEHEHRSMCGLVELISKVFQNMSG